MSGSAVQSLEVDVDKTELPLQAPAPPPPPGPPDGGLRAWLTTVGGFLVLTATFGYSNAFGVYEDFYVLSGASSSSNISWIGSLQLYFMFAMGLPAGRLFDRGYFHYLMGFGALLYVFSLFMLSLANPHKYYQLILSQGVGMGIGSGLMLVPTMSVQAHHWRARRSLAMGIVMSGSGVGGLIYPIMLNRLIHGSAGFAWGVRATAFVNLGILGIANAIMTTRLPPAKGGQASQNINYLSFLADADYIIFLVGAFGILWGLFYPYFYLQLWVNVHGLSPTLAFYTIAILNAASIFGRTLPNRLADRIGPFNVLIPMTVISSALIFAMFGATSTGSVIVFSILYGIFSGASIALLPPAIATLSKGVHEIGARFGLSYFIVSHALLTGTPIVGALYDEGHRWYKPTVFSGVVIGAAAVALTISRSMIARRKGTKWV